MSISLVLDPAFDFGALDGALQSLGFRRDNSVGPFTQDMIAGEPEVAAWIRGDAGERITYTFNPVVSLRVIACAAESEAELAARFPLIDIAGIGGLLTERDPRRVLLGLFAARALAADELAGAIAPLCAHPNQLIRSAAERALEWLQPDGEAAAQGEVLSVLPVLCEQAVSVFSALVGPEGPATIESMRPRSDDYPRVFHPEIVAASRAAYEMLWSTPPRVERLTVGELKLRVDAAPAAMLRNQNELSNRFPGGYRALAPHLQPNRIWFVWRYLRAGNTVGMRYDGVVHLDNRWVWFPKPYRVIGEILRGPSCRRP